jgi:4-hydroxy-3-polyprenylbenzoate decarboxylase
MIVAPLLGAQHERDRHGRDLHLLTRAADVTLKERRPLVLMVRETPLHLGHLRTMVKLAEMGAVIAPRCRPSTPSRRAWRRWSTSRWAAR